MTVLEVSSDLTTCQDQVQRLMAMRRQAIAHGPQMVMQWAYALEVKLQQVCLIAGWLTQFPAANDAAGQGDVA